MAGQKEKAESILLGGEAVEKIGPDDQGLESMSIADSIRGRMFSISRGADLPEPTQAEVDFLDAWDLKKLQDKGVVLEPDEIEHVQGFSDMTNLVGTRFEPELGPALGQGPFGEGVMQEHARENLTTTEDLARQEAFVDGAGLLDEKMQANFFKALQKAQAGISGDMDFSGVMTEFNKLQAETQAERDIVKSEFPEAYETSKLATEIMTAGGAGAMAAKNAAKLATKIPKAIPSIPGAIAKTPLGRTGILSAEVLGSKAGSEVIGAGVGAAASEAFVDPEALLKGDFSKVSQGGVFGAGIDGLLKGVVGAAGPVTSRLAPLIEQQSERIRDAAARIARRSISAVRKPFLRALKRQNITEEQFGRELLLSESLPTFTTFRVDDYIDKSLEARRIGVGGDLGRFYDEADEFSNSLMKKLRTEGEKAVGPLDSIQRKDDLLDALESDLHVDLGRVADRIRKIGDEIDPADIISEDAGAQKILLNWAEHLDDLPDKKRTIREALKLKTRFIAKLQSIGSLTPAARTVARRQAEWIVQDQIKQTTVKNLNLKKLIGDDFNQFDIEKAYGGLAQGFQKAIEKMDINPTPETVQEILSMQSKMSDLSKTYRIVKTAQDFFEEKQISQSSNRMFSLTDFITAGAIGGGGMASGGDGLELGAGGLVLSKILRERAPFAGARSLNFLANRVKNLGVAAGKHGIPPKVLAEMPELTPAIYLSLTRPNSPMQMNQFMVINDAKNLEVFKAGLSDSEDMTSVQKANAISEINKNGEVRLFYKGSDKEADAHTTQGLSGFKERLETFVPNTPEPQDLKKGVDAFDFSQSPLFGKKKVGEPVPSGRPTGNLPMNKQIQGFLDTIMGTTQIGIDPQETFPESQISPEELELMNAQAGVPPGGKLFSLDKRRRSKAFEESEKKIEGIIEDLGGGNKTLQEFNKIVDQHNGEYKSIRKSGEEFLIELSDGGRFPDGRKSKRFGSLDEAKNFVIFENRGLGKESRDEILDELKDFRRKRGNVSIVDDASMKKEAEALFRKLLKLTPGTPEYKRILEQLDTIGAIPK